MQQAMSCHNNNWLQLTKQTQNCGKLSAFYRKAGVKRRTCSSNWQHNCNI